MFFKQFYEPRLAQYSYMLACPASGEALIVDPLRDIDSYLAEAESQSVRITHVTETHIHADYLSGARALAHVTGAELLLSDEGGPDWLYPHVGLRHGDAFRVGNVEVRALHTPGHTPEHLADIEYWRRTGHPLVELKQITAEALNQALEEGRDLVHVDVREESEYAAAISPTPAFYRVDGFPIVSTNCPPTNPWRFTV